MSRRHFNIFSVFIVICSELESPDPSYCTKNINCIKCLFELAWFRPTLFTLFACMTSKWTPCILGCVSVRYYFRCLLPTSFAGIVDEHDLHEQVSWRAADDTVNRPQQGAPRLVVKHNDDAGVWQVIWIHLGLTADEATGEKKKLNQESWPE